MSAGTPALATRGLVVGHGDRRILEVDDLELPLGAWWAVLGPNGCGKTTLLDTIAGRKAALSGSVFIDGHSMTAAPRRARSALGVVLPPDVLPPRLTLRECLAVFCAAHGRSKPAADVEELVGAWGLAGRLDEFVDRSSLGTRQKLAVLLALVSDPKLLVLDESFNGLDPASGIVLKNHLDQRVRGARCSVLLATHALDIVEQHADCALLIDRGRVRARLGRRELEACRGRLDVRLAERLSTVSAP
ncbi:MAG: ATP-binding cassette domain-containing protein [Wenzhouxiangellaceae bacterium]|nr:ATP-binding cassette domain-containing protein [Wenzhouxiangellaceae bacterium]